MKTRIVSLIVGLLGWNVLAQTAGQDVTNGLQYLCNTNLVGANTNFNNALALSPTNEDANALVAVTRLLLLPTQPAGSNFLNGLGFTNSGRNVYNWTSTLPKDTNGNTVFPTENTSVMIAFYRTNIMAALGASRTNLAMITDTNFSLSLTACETSLQAVTVDYGDVLLLQALLRAAEFAGYTLNAQNFDVVLSQLQTLEKTNGLTLQNVLSLYPSLLNQNSASDLAASEGALTNAIALYLAASEFIRNDRQPGSNYLFNLSPDEANNEALFRTELTNTLLSLNAPVQFFTNNALEIYAGAYFAGAKSLRSLMPQFTGDVYVNDTLPDFTFDGILVNLPAYKTEAILRKEFYSYAGIYVGDGGLQDNNPSGPFGGSFAVFVGTNQQATLLGTDNGNGTGDGTDFGLFFQFSVTKGNWQFSSGSISGYGSIDKDGFFNGEIDGLTNGQGQIVSVYLNATNQPALGPFQNAAGFYTGSYSGPYSGTLQGVVVADGSVLFDAFQNGQVQDGGSGQIDPANNQFTGTTGGGGGTTLGGTFTLATLTISGHFTNSPANGGGTGTFTLSNPTRIPFDVPPVITTNLPANKIVALGVNAAFFLSATGSPPMCYQWFFNSNAIPFATTNTLVVSNNLWTSTGTYYVSASVNNAVGGTNSQQCAVTVTTETTSPTLAITNITSGMLVSNAAFTVMGTASDKVAVTNVYCSLSNAMVNTGFVPATMVNNWSNWSAAVTLAPGTNTVRAYAVNTGGIPSTTNSATIVYIVSAVLTVQTNGSGTVSPNYNGTLLQIGKNYSMTATAGSGFAFVNWTGSITTNGATLQFTMASNLTFTANFADVTKPVLAITNITAGLQVSNAFFTVMGTATDNVAVAGVYCSLSNAVINTGFALATTANNWANWSTNLTLTPGTNTVRAYAVDTSGNISTTNSATIVYILSAPLTVSTNGNGTISPNYNGALLQIGKNYSMTATAGSGFAFVNWTGSITTNGATLQFTMASNLTFTANFADVTKPVLSITNVTAGMNVSNANFIVKGWATDNVAVASVYFQLNTSVWSNATSFNGSNWTAAVTLTPGTNTIAAYAVDTSGNLSLTNTLNFFYVVNATLMVSTNGLGSLSPNDNGLLLQIGKGYSITATAGTGFVFTNWTGGTNLPLSIITNGTTVQFLMVTNLMLQANLVEVAKPSLTITAPTAGQQMTNALATVVGTASDNWKVAAVWYQLTNGILAGGTWSLANTTNNYTNWTTTVTLAVGTNMVKAYAVNLGGNFSTTNSVSFVSSNVFKLLLAFTTAQPLATNGLNFALQLSPGLNGHVLVSTDLVDWVALTNFTGTNATINFRDAAATNFNNRFYRAVIP